MSEVVLNRLVGAAEAALVRLAEVDPGDRCPCYDGADPDDCTCGQDGAHALIQVNLRAAIDAARAAPLSPELRSIERMRADVADLPPGQVPHEIRYYLATHQARP